MNRDMTVYEYRIENFPLHFDLSKLRPRRLAGGRYGRLQRSDSYLVRESRTGWLYGRSRVEVRGDQRSEA